MIRKILCALGLHFFNEIRFTYELKDHVTYWRICKYCKSRKCDGEQRVK